MRSLAVFLLVVCGSPLAAQDCNENILIDSVEYDVPQRWCGQKLDSTQIADPMKLVRLPEELSFDDYRIYVSADTRDALVRMAGAAGKDSIELLVDSGYRSASYQKRIIRRRLSEGEDPAAIMAFVAPPGYSQHQTGRAVDFVPSEAAFANTPAYRWLKEHAAEFGFVETYPETSASGHAWESWHWYHAPSE
jgi:LAS superfamily LD-carboxypeptidase LdcB